MDITNIRIFPYTKNPESALKATATVVVNDGIILQSIRIRVNANDPDKLDVVYPARELRDGSRRACFFFSNKEQKEAFDEKVIAAYRKVMADPQHQDVKHSDPGFVPFKITRSSIFPYPASTTQAIARVNVELDGELWLRGMTLLARDDGSMWLGMPRRPLRDSDMTMDVFHPVSQEARQMLVEQVIPLYEAALEAEVEMPVAA